MISATRAKHMITMETVIQRRTLCPEGQDD